MDNGFLNNLFEELKHDNQCLFYQGSFSNELMTKIIGLSEANQKHYKEEFKTQRRVSYLMAECFQNIVKHGDRDESVDTSVNESSFFMNRNSCGKHYILSANLVNHENQINLKSHIDSLNKLSDDELKSLYKKTIKEGVLSDKGGAGLGLIDMARKSGYKLDYAFVEFNDDSSIFYNQIVLDSGAVDNQEAEEKRVGVGPGIEFHKLLNTENILMVQKGDFSQESILPVLTIIEKSIIGKASRSAQMKNVYRVMVELLQNVSKHALPTNEIRDGIFSLAKRDDKFIVSTGNYMINGNVEDLQNHFNEIKKLDAEKLEDLYTETLMNNLDDDSDNPGLGLINLAQISAQNMELTIDKVDEEKSFFCMHVTV